MLDPRDTVFGVANDGAARTYPRYVLAWHEVVNDAFADRPVVIHVLSADGNGDRL